MLAHLTLISRIVWGSPYGLMLMISTNLVRDIGGTSHHVSWRIFCLKNLPSDARCWPRHFRKNSFPFGKRAPAVSACARNIYNIVHWAPTDKLRQICPRHLQNLLAATFLLVPLRIGSFLPWLPYLLEWLSSWRQIGAFCNSKFISQPACSLT